MPLKLCKSRQVGREVDLGEEEQRYPHRFAYADVEGETVYKRTPWVKCREFLTDCLYWTVAGDSTYDEIYGFHNPGRINLEYVSLLMTRVSNPDNLLGMINEMERHFNVPTLTTISPVETTQTKVYLILADKWWFSTTALLSYYTFILRAIDGTKKTSWQELDKHDYMEFSSYLQDHGNFETVRKLVWLRETVPGQLIYTKDRDTGSRHCMSGFKAALLKKYNHTIYKEVMQNAN